jgi:hypothetical protein
MNNEEQQAITDRAMKIVRFIGIGIVILFGLYIAPAVLFGIVATTIAILILKNSFLK